MKNSSIVRLSRGDHLFKYVTMRGIFEYKVVGVRVYENLEQYEIECKDCKDHKPCRLLIVQVDNVPKFRYVAMLNEEDENQQHYWHDDPNKYFHTNKKECKVDEGKMLLSARQKKIDEVEQNLLLLKREYEEIKIWMEQPVK